MKKTAKIIFIALLAYVSIFITDYVRVTNKKAPVFCVKKEHEEYNTYHGLGYTYEICTHAVTGKNEYALFMLGKTVSSDYTNEVQNDISADITVTTSTAYTSSLETSQTISKTQEVTTSQSVHEISEKRSNIVVISSYRNWADGYQHRGTFIDFDGKVYEFDFSTEQISDDDVFIARLEEYYHSIDVGYVQTIDNPDLLFEIAVLADLVSHNPEIIKEHNAYDAGQNTVYVLNSDNKLVKLYSNGDYIETNTDQYAMEAADLCRML